MRKRIEELINLIGKRHVKYRNIGMQELVNIGVKALEPLINALLFNKNSYTRRNAALVLGKIGHHKAVWPLIKALKDNVSAVRWNAAIALGLIGDRRAVPSLLKQLNSSSWQLRLNSVVSLGWIADKRAIEPLLRLINDKNLTVRKAAAYALGNIKAPEIKHRLEEILKEFQGQHLEAALALTFYGDLKGFYYLENRKPFHFESLPYFTKMNIFKGRKKSKAIEAYRLGNIFYKSGMYHLALPEYYKAVMIDSKRPSNSCIAFLNNLANTFRQLGMLEQSILFYLLALKLAPGCKEISENIEIVEAIIETCEVIKDQIFKYLKEVSPAWLQIRPEIRDILNQFCNTFVEQLEEDELSDTEVEKLKPVLNAFIVLGYKVFNCLERFQGRKEEKSKLISVAFIVDHVQSLYEVFIKENPFRALQLILFDLLEQFKKNLPLESICMQEKDFVLIESILDEFFIYGYLIGMAEKIFYRLHPSFSYN